MCCVRPYNASPIQEARQPQAEVEPTGQQSMNPPSNRGKSQHNRDGTDAIEARPPRSNDPGRQSNPANPRAHEKAPPACGRRSARSIFHPTKSAGAVDVPEEQGDEQQPGTTIPASDEDEPEQQQSVPTSSRGKPSARPLSHRTQHKDCGIPPDSDRVSGQDRRQKRGREEPDRQSGDTSMVMEHIHMLSGTIHAVKEGIESMRGVHNSVISLKEQVDKISASSGAPSSAQTARSEDEAPKKKKQKRKRRISLKKLNVSDRGDATGQGNKLPVPADGATPDSDDEDEGKNTPVVKFRTMMHDRLAHVKTAFSFDVFYPSILRFILQHCLDQLDTSEDDAVDSLSPEGFMEIWETLLFSLKATETKSVYSRGRGPAALDIRLGILVVS